MDRLLLERGEFDPVDCLIGLGLLRQTEADARHGGGIQITAALLAPVGEAVTLLEQAHAYAVAQDLVPVLRSSAVPQHITASPNTEARRLMELCGSILRHAEDGCRQSDLFHDSAPAAALSELKEALAEHRVEAARLALQRLTDLSPDRQSIDDYTRLFQALVLVPTRRAERVRELERTIAPLAWRCLGAQARDYLSPLWSELAAALRGTAFSPDMPRLHASYAHGQAQQWGAVVACVEDEPGWPQQATLVARLAEARAGLGQENRARKLWAELCWHHPQTAPAVLAAAPGDPVVARLWAQFVDADSELAVGDFPAWLLLADSRQVHFVPAKYAPDNDQGRAYAALHRLVTSGGYMEARIALHALRPDLLRLYLAAKNLRAV